MAVIIPNNSYFQFCVRSPKISHSAPTKHFPPLHSTNPCMELRHAMPSFPHCSHNHPLRICLAHASWTVQRGLACNSLPCCAARHHRRDANSLGECILFWGIGATSSSVAHRRPQVADGTRVGIMLFERIWTDGTQERGHLRGEGQRAMDTILIPHVHTLGLLVFPLLSAYPWCRFFLGITAFWNWKNLRHSVVLPSWL